MGRKEDLIAEVGELESPEGRLAFLMNRTLLSRERTESIDRLGAPWPVVVSGFEDLPGHMEALRRGEVTNEEGVNHLTATNAYAQMLDLELKTKKRWEPDERVTDYLKEIATLSGETYDTINDFYLAHLAHGQRIFQLFEEFNKVIQAEEK